MDNEISLNGSEIGDDDVDLSDDVSISQPQPHQNNMPLKQHLPPGEIIKLSTLLLDTIKNHVFDLLDNDQFIGNKALFASHFGIDDIKSTFSQWLDTLEPTEVVDVDIPAMVDEMIRWHIDNRV